MSTNTEVKLKHSKMYRKKRTIYANWQIRELVTYFNSNAYLDAYNVRKLSEKTKISEDQIYVWFKNRRAKIKSKLLLSYKQILDRNYL